MYVFCSVISISIYTYIHIYLFNRTEFLFYSSVLLQFRFVITPFPFRIRTSFFPPGNFSVCEVPNDQCYIYLFDHDCKAPLWHAVQYACDIYYYYYYYETNAAFGLYILFLFCPDVKYVFPGCCVFLNGLVITSGKNLVSAILASLLISYIITRAPRGHARRTRSSDTMRFTVSSALLETQQYTYL